MPKWNRNIGIVLILTGVIFCISFAHAEGFKQDEGTNHLFVTEDIYFKAGSYAILPEAEEILKRKAAWLRAHPKAIVVIEGHTDSRNSREANLAFGEWRAGAVKTYLMRMGIDGARLRAPVLRIGACIS